MEQCEFSANRTSGGARGRPKVQISREQILFLQKKNYTGVQMAAHFKCSKQTMYNRLRQENIKLSEKFSTIDDGELDETVRALHEEFPNTGSKMMQGYLQTKGLVIQRQRVREALGRVDPQGTKERWGKTVKRRTYKVATPNSIWHMDAHMKLIR